ncbi:hypothetical protein ABB55_06970 [Prosthecomicrobium hirschii]|uniref:Pyridoxamine 5'-phosphate oxidase N-terminal domain-containing protein n=1 Tax=Prosthecodimorpha hirschii TaxID=665126 RepID=A0A0P6W3F1_9HYPH|nr:pyridoxamine 5'-phosphate oxidase family protein [Prosthecomicrobium hirschii]KPL52000.1 hypothetical protein ABB55_06970 [Prosthecomicrobium hirschii]
MIPSTCDVAFTLSVKAEQARRGSRRHYADYEARGGFEADLSNFPRAFLERIDTAFLGTVNADGQPYIQHRGGPRGFIRILDDATLAFAERRGNRQYVSTGNLADNPKAFLFLIDYETRSRIKIWGRARFSADIAAHAPALGIDPDDMDVERVLIFEVVAWEANCPKHIPRKVDAGAVMTAVEALRARIGTLEAENRRLASLLALQS